MRRAPLALCLLLAATTPAFAQVSLNFSVPGGSIGLNLGGYPALQPIPGYPVYYAPGVNSNYFFYDGMYWVFQNNNWYASSWYNGPWALVDPYYVPPYILRVPVRYYRHAPVYFRGWRSDAAPHWGEHWGPQWEQRRSGWDNWDRKSAPRPAPLPTYQRQYSGNRYPHEIERQSSIQTQSYRYAPHDPVAQQHYEERRGQQRDQQQQQQQQRAQQQQQQQQQRAQQQQQRDQQHQQQRDQQRQQQPQQQQQHDQQRQQHDQQKQLKEQQDRATNDRG
jgi:hypothetical protein